MQLIKIFSYSSNFESIMINSKDDATILNHLSENYFKEDAPKILGVVKPG